MANKVKEVWVSGKAVVNAWLAIPSWLSAEVIAQCGFDSVTVDMQHGVDYQAMTTQSTTKNRLNFPYNRHIFFIWMVPQSWSVRVFPGCQGEDGLLTLIWINFNTLSQQQITAASAKPPKYCQSSNRQLVVRFSYSNTALEPIYLSDQVVECVRL